MNRSRNQALLLILMILFLGILLVGVTWSNYQYTQKNPGGNDFLVHWVGTRVLFYEGISPYSDEAALRIQTIAYGRPARPGEHELRVAYPLYSVVFFLPFALISDFNLARAVWMTVLEASLVGITLLSLRLCRWKPSPFMLAGLLIFSLLWYHGLRPLINGNAVILVALFITGGLLALRDGADELAGVLFAFATIKPQVVVLIVAFLLLWGIGQRRWRFVGWLVGTVGLLSLAAGLIFPDWIIQNLREVLRYPAYNPPGTPGAAFAQWWPSFGARLGWALTFLTALMLIVEWRSGLRAEFRGFLWTALLTLNIAQWIGIQTDPGNFVVLFPGIILAFALMYERWHKGAAIASSIILLVLFVGIWAIFLSTVQYGDQPVQSPVMFFPLPFVMFVLLYWVRWWAFHPLGAWMGWKR